MYTQYVIFEKSTLTYACPEECTQVHIKDGVREERVNLKEWKLSHEEIQNASTIVYKDLKSPYVDLRVPEANIRMSIEGYPILALWTSDMTSPFLCIEPWYGHGDFEQVNVPFEKREGMMLLSPNKAFTTSYWVEITE